MSVVRSATGAPSELVRATVLVLAVVVLATIATLVFSGQTLWSFDVTPNLMLPEWTW